MDGFTIPNRSDALPIEKLSWPYSTDIAALTQGIRGEGVGVGCKVTQLASPGMGVTVADGIVVIAGESVDVTGDDLAIAAAHAVYERCDLIVCDDFGTISVVEGEADAASAPQSIPDDSVLLALLRVPANDTIVTNAQIVDKRVMVKMPTPHVSSAILVPKLVTETSPGGSTFQDDDELFFAVSAFETWSFSALLFLESDSNTAHSKFSFSAPAGADLRFGSASSLLGDYPATAVGLSQALQTPNEPFGVVKYLTNVAAGHVLGLVGRVAVGATAGFVKLRWAQQNAETADLSVLSSSSLELRPLTEES